MEGVAEFLSIHDSGSGNGYGSGSGSGYGYGYGSGNGNGYGYGSGNGSGSGNGNGSGYGYGYGSGNGNGNGSGYGYGYGSGNGNGSGSGYGSGNGYGSGSGYGYGLKSINGMTIYDVDGISTIITAVRGNMAKGFILQSDLTMKKCFIAKAGNCFAHGETAREAYEAARAKLFKDMPEEERVAAFIAEFELGRKYPVKTFSDWHNRLTGSCEMGRRAFAADNGIDIENGEMTVEEFISITENAYGGEVIRALKSELHQ